MRPAEQLLEVRDRVLGRRQGRAAAAAPAQPPVELIEQRTVCSKVFQLDRRRRHLSQSVVPVHYEAGDGLAEIDTAFVTESDGTIAMRRAPYEAVVLEGVVGWRHISRRGGWMQMELLAIDGEPVTGPSPRVVDDQVFWDQVIPGVDLKLVAYPGGSEMFKRLDGPRELEWLVTQSPDFAGRLNETLTGWDRRGDRLEIITSRDGDVFRERWTGRVSRVVDPVTRRKEWVFPDQPGRVVVDASISEDIVANADDGFSLSNNNTWRSAAETNWYWGAFNGSTNLSNAALRWQTLAIPAGASIDAATLTVNITIDSSAPPARIYGNDVDDAPVWSNSNLPRLATRTTAYRQWSPTATGVQSTDVLGPVAEVLGRAGWTSGNDLALMILPYGATAGYGAAEDYGAAGTDPAQLDVTFTTALIEYTGSGGLVLGGAADVEEFHPVLIEYTGTGGLVFGGAADVEEFHPVLVQYTGAGGLVFGGAATLRVGGAQAASDIVVEWDFDADGDFDQAEEEDITSFVLQLETFAGRDWPSLLTGKAGPGRLRATLRNDDDRFSYFNTDSPLNQGSNTLDTGRKLRVRTTSASEPDPAVLAVDRFNRADTSASLGDTEDGLTWSAASGTWEVDEMRAVVVGTPSGAIAVVDVGQADYFAQVRLAEVGGDASASDEIGGNVVGLVYRFQDTSNYSLGVVDVDAAELQLIDVVAGSPTTVATRAVEVYDDMTIGVLVSGSSVSLYQEGVALLTGTAIQIDETQVGMYASRGSRNTVPALDDFFVWASLPAEVEGCLWTGDGSLLSNSVAAGPHKLAEIQGQGWLSRLSAQQFSPPPTAAGRKTGILTGNALAAAFLIHPPGALDEGQISTGPFASRDINALEMVRRLEETEFGFLYEQPEGYLGFDDRAARNGSTSLVTFSDAPGTQFGYHQIAPLDWRREVFNRVNAGVTPQLPDGISLTTHTQPTFNASNPLTITMPATVNAGDLLLVAISVTGTGSGANTFENTTWEPPDGFTQLYDSNTDIRGTRIYAKIAVGSEDSAGLTFATDGAGTDGAAVAHIWRITDWFGDLSGVAAAGPLPGLTQNVVLPVPWGLQPALYIAILHGVDFDPSATTSMITVAALDYTDLNQATASSADDKVAAIASCRRFGISSIEEPEWNIPGTINERHFQDLKNYHGIVAVRGYAGDPPGSGVTVQRDDTDSQDARNAIRTHRLSSKLFASESDAATYGDLVLDTYAQDRPILVMSFWASKNAAHRAQAIRRRISDRITVKATSNAGLGISRDFYIENITHRFTLGKTLWETIWELSPVAVTPGLNLPGAAGDYAATPDHDTLDITGDLDLRIDATLPTWAEATADNRTLIAKYRTDTDERSYWLLITTAGELRLQWSTDGTSGTILNRTADATLPASAGDRLAVRATLDVDDGGNNTVTFYTAETLAGPWTQLGTPQSGAGTTSIHSGTAELTCGAFTDGSGAGAVALLTGLVHALEVRDGIGGTTVADPDFSAQANGDDLFVDNAGRAWSVNGAAMIVNNFS